MNAGRQAGENSSWRRRWRIVGGASESVLLLVSSSSTRSRTSLWSPIADDETPRHGLEHGHEAVQVYAATCTPYRGDRRPPGNVGVQLSPVVSTSPGPRLLPRRVRRGGTDHEARRAFGTLQRALEHAARI